MKRILLSIITLCAYSVLNAQVKPDMFEFLSTFERKTTIEEFKSKYGDSFHPLNDTLQIPDDTGLFFTDLFSYDGKPSVQIVVIDPDTGVVTLCAIPDATKLDSLAYSQASAEFKNYIINKIGEPDEINEDISENADFLARFTDVRYDNGKRYLWENASGEAEYAAFAIRSNGTETFIFMVMPPSVEEEPKMPVGESAIPIQRIFFKKLELGKYFPSYQLTSYLGVSSDMMVEKKTSEGGSYTIIYDGYFGGQQWDFVEVKSVDYKLSSIEFTNTQTDDNTFIYDSLLEKLTDKYGEPMVLSTGGRSWYDSYTILSLYHTYAKSTGGEWRHYVVLTYVDRDLYNQGESKALDEL